MWIDGSLTYVQYRLYETNNINPLRLQYDCLYYYAINNIVRYTHPIENIREIVPYCIRPAQYNENIFEELSDSDHSWTFDELRQHEITSQQLYQWSAPVDLVELYEIYLLSNHNLSNESSMISNKKFCNCSLPRFGQVCEYEFDWKNALSMSDTVRGTFAAKVDNRLILTQVTNGTCYKHLINCDIGPTPLCLDWREVCDGKVDCKNTNGFDDEYDCKKLEFNVCDEHEFQCHNGQCISDELYNDDPMNPDCLDGSDELYLEDFPLRCTEDPALRCEARTSYNRLMFPCGDGTDTSFPPAGRCANRRADQFGRILLSYEHNPSISYQCWTAIVNALRFSLLVDIDKPAVYPCFNLDDSCIQYIKLNCKGPLFVFPTLGLFSGHVHLMLMLNGSHTRMESFPIYICVNQNEPTCVFASTLSNWRISSFTNDIMTTVWSLLNTHKVECNITNGLFQCENSTRCISSRRMVDGISDCYDKSDELSNASCTLKEKRRYTCMFENKCLSHLLVNDKHRYCRNLTDEHVIEVATSLSFPTICDGFKEITLTASHDTSFSTDLINETDETNCHYWPCNNIYTRCDHFWNCKNGLDETNCSRNCQWNEFECISPYTFDWICLSVDHGGDGIVDCLGGSDERFHCRTTMPTISTARYLCLNTTKCVLLRYMCDTISKIQCPLNDDEAFCDIKHPLGICHYYPVNGIPIDKHDPRRNFLCNLDESTKPSVLHFRLDIQSIENSNQHLQEEIPTSELIDDDNRQSSYQLSTLSDVELGWLCNRGVFVWFWIGKTKNSRCLCPPSYYGERCEFQNQRVSISIRLKTFEWHQIFKLVVILIDNYSIIHSSDQHIFLSAYDCNVRFDMTLLYADRPKNESKSYTIRIDIFEAHNNNQLNFRASWEYPVMFPMLPVYRLSTILTIPTERTRALGRNCFGRQCINGECFLYTNTQQSYCRCLSGWSGLSCEKWHGLCHCENGSICFGIYSRSICICPLNKYGHQCLLNYTKCYPYNPCKNNGICIPTDMRISEHTFKCLCKIGYTGILCELKETEIEITFSDKIAIPSSVFIHLITVMKDAPPLRTTTFKKIRFDQDSAILYTSSKFNIIFVQFTNFYYLGYLQINHQSLSKFYLSIQSSKRCLSIDELFNLTILSYPPLRRLKYYHIPCQERENLICMYDKEYMCLCTNERHANCFQFNHNMIYNCNGISYCQNGAQCFQDHPTCPSSIMCVCDECFYGTMCQFSTNEFSLSLDTILGYQIQPHLSIYRQPLSIKLSALITMLIFLIGIINFILSMITFQSKHIRVTGCGIYLLISSINSIFIIILFTNKFWILVLTQIGTITNRSFLKFNCITVDFFLKVLLSMNDWLNACIALERGFTVIKGVHFNQSKSKKLAKYVIVFLFLFNILTFIYDPFYRRMIDDIEEQRTWCIIIYSSNLRIINSIVNLGHSLLPFIINIISALIIIINVARNRFISKKQQTFFQHFNDQFHQHKDLFISPIILIILVMPRLVISFISGCMKSARNPWIYLLSYFISLMPPLLTFFVFVLPSDAYKNQFIKSIITIRTFFKNVCSRT